MSWLAWIACAVSGVVVFVVAGRLPPLIGGLLGWTWFGAWVVAGVVAQRRAAKG